MNRDLERIDALHRADMEASLRGDQAALRALTFESGHIVGRQRRLDSGEQSSKRYHVMRVLQRQPDGEWKVHRTIWNTAAP